MQTLMRLESLRILRGQLTKKRITRKEFEFQASVFVIAQSILHRNVTPANNFISAFRGHKRTLLAELIEKYGDLACSRMDGKFLCYHLRNITSPFERRTRTIEKELRRELCPLPPPKESGRTRTLFDESIKNNTKNASKLAKQRRD